MPCAFAVYSAPPGGPCVRDIQRTMGECPMERAAALLRKTLHVCAQNVLLFCASGRLGEQCSFLRRVIPRQYTAHTRKYHVNHPRTLHERSSKLTWHTESRWNSETPREPFANARPPLAGHTANTPHLPPLHRPYHANPARCLRERSAH